MTNGKINRKYFVLIWVALIAACFMRNAYSIYSMFTSMEEVSRLLIIQNVMITVFSYGAIPAVIVFVLALITWQIGASRYVRCVSRNDFCYTVMLVSAAVYFLVGFIEIFSILNEDIAAVTTTVIQPLLLTGAFLAMFFLVFTRMYKFNPVEKYNSFKMWSTVYMILAGLSVIGQSGLVLLLVGGGPLASEILIRMNALGYGITLTEIQFNCSVAAICIYVAYLIAFIVIGEMMRKKANKFRNPETRGDYYAQFDNRAYTMRNDAERVFDEESVNPSAERKKEENVFEEFDL